jgi:cobalt-zinc-cadmium efflux system outer membrane protein
MAGGKTESDGTGIIDVVDPAEANAANAEEADQAGQESDSYSRFVDNSSGATADDLVGYALDHNGELGAARQMIAEATGRLHQAGLKPNPMLESSYQKSVTTADNTFAVGADLPLELSRRRPARVAVAERELDLRKAEAADFERKLAADVRTKYAAAVVAARNLKLSEDGLKIERDSYRLVAARVQLGKTAPLERNTMLVEVNRIRAMRLDFLSKSEVAILDIKKTIGMPPDTPLRIREDFPGQAAPPAQQEAIRQALISRPDLVAARAAEALAQAQIEQARVEGKVDASIFANYQRMNLGFSQRGFDSQGALVPVQGVFHMATFGVRLSLPVRNKNQGAIEAAIAAAEGARQTRLFDETAVRNEVAAAYARFERARQALDLYRDGVLHQSGQNLDVVRQTYLLGQKTMIDYAAEMRRYVDIETGFTDILKEYLESMVDIQKAMGTAAVH